LFHVWAVTVDEAFAAGTFFVLEDAFVQTKKSVFAEFLAFGADFAFFGAVVVVAVDVYHVAYGFLFPDHSFVGWVRRLRLHTGQLQKGRLET
jgi:hypothetical protein